ncbi:MAG: hypothetical protein WDO24_14810 [Pseudomonadota bacterium]
MKRKSSGTPTAPISVPLSQEELLKLLQRLDTQLADRPGRVVQLVGPSRGCGVSTIASALAEVALKSVREPVLLVDGDCEHPTHEAMLKLRCPHSLPDMIRDHLSLADTIVPIAGTELSLAVLAKTPAPRGEAIPIHILEQILVQIRQAFRWAIIDSAPAFASSDTTALFRHVDATIVVIEAENTRIPVAQQLLADIKANGGNPAGIVVNKRQFHIPSAIYRRL